MAAPSPAHVWQEATIERIAQQTATVKSLFLRPQSFRPFTAGQHLDVRLTAPDGYRAQRSYSIASAPETDGLYELVVELMPDGEVSPYFHEIAEAGDTIEIRGPLGGHFNWRSDEGGPILLVGGGSGVVPLMSMLRHRRARGGETRLLLVCGARSYADLLFRDELLAPEGPAIEVMLALSRDTPRRPQDIAGRIGEPLLARALDLLGSAPRLTFLCGSNPFVEAVSQPLVRLGVPAAAIRTERFGG